MERLTKQQERVLKFVKSYIAKSGYPPTREEISDHFGWASCNSAQQHLQLIQRKGYLKLMPGKVSRGIIVL